jgi:citrate synthase
MIEREVYAGTTAISRVDPETNSLTYRGYPVQELARTCSFEEVLLRRRRAALAVAPRRPADGRRQSRQPPAPTMSGWWTSSTTAKSRFIPGV